MQGIRRDTNDGMKTFTITTIGCKVNQYDSQLIREALIRGGCRERGMGDSRADVCIINTCAVTRTSEAKSRRAVRRAARQHPGAAIIVTGCCADSDPRGFGSLEGVTHVLGNRLKGRIARIVVGETAEEVRSVTGLSGRTRALIKIQDGCDFACSYCIVPRVRGRSRSREPDDIIAEARTLVLRGHSEIVLTGIHLGSYGRDRGERSALERLIRALESMDDLARIRLSSIQPREVTDELIDIMASGGKLCPHLHIPLQSGDDRVLRAMGRAYSAADYRELVERVRERVPDASLTTDIMVGFPAETEDAFLRTREMVRHTGFSRVHIFPYSPRPGTAAWRLGDPVPERVKQRRRSELAEVADEAAMAYRRRFVGKCVEVIVQEPGGEPADMWGGLSREYLRVSFEGKSICAGAVRRVRVEGITAEGLRGRSECC